MVDINWNLFKEKFNGREEDEFENLAYHLFCEEKNQKIGIFRFKNQTGIETEPIFDGSEWVAFQAKYSISEIKQKRILDSIRKAKSKNPKLARILVYLYDEISESPYKTQKNPKYKTEIEDDARNLEVSIEWRVRSNIEIQLAKPENEHLAEYFFTNDGGIVKFLQNIQGHSERLLNSIHTDIPFSGNTIKLDRQSILDQIRNVIDDSRLIFVFGESGQGKSAIIKEFYNKYKNEFPVYFFNATEFNIININELFKNYGQFYFPNFVKAEEDEKIKVAVIDSAEKVLDFDNRIAFTEFVSELIKNKWCLIFTSRLNSVNNLNDLAKSLSFSKIETIKIEPIEEDILNNLSIEYQFNLPKDSRNKRLLTNSFYLSEYLKNYSDADTDVSFASFKESLLSKRIEGRSTSKSSLWGERANCFLNIVSKRASTGSFIVFPENFNHEALYGLVLDEVLIKDEKTGGYFISHDQYEDYGLGKIVERTFIDSSSYEQFFKIIGDSHLMRRAFHQWITLKQNENPKAISPLIEYVLRTDGIDDFWRDELLVGILMSKNSEELLMNLLDVKNVKTLEKLSTLLKVRCVEEYKLSSSLESTDSNSNSKFLLTRPKGSGWNSFIHFAFENEKSLEKESFYLTLPLLYEWTLFFPQGITTRESGLLALNYYKQITSKYGIRGRLNRDAKPIKIILLSAQEIKPELSRLFDEILANPELLLDRHDVLLEAIFGNDGLNTRLIYAIPSYILRLAEKYWLIDENEEIEDVFYTRHEMEYYFGLNDNHLNYFPASAYQTPIYWLLKYDTVPTLNFIVSFTNHCIDNYVQKGKDQSIIEIKTRINDSNIITQYISHGLWNMYRGTGSPVTPYLLQSIHMALEKFLLETSKVCEIKTMETLLTYLIAKSKSASITSVVASIVLAEPEKFYNIAKILFSSSDLIYYDRMRVVRFEIEAKSLYSLGYGFDKSKRFFEEERLKTCEDSHRNRSLGDLMIQYQFFRSDQISEKSAKVRITEIGLIFDELLKEINNLEKDGQEYKTKMALISGLDRRNMNPIVENRDNMLYINFNPRIPPEFLEEDKGQHENQPNDYSELIWWGISKFGGTENQGLSEKYNNNPTLALNDARSYMEKIANEHNIDGGKNLGEFAYLFAALIKCYSSDLSKAELLYCGDFIFDLCIGLLEQNRFLTQFDGAYPSISVLPELMALDSVNKIRYLEMVLLLMFNDIIDGAGKTVSYYAIEIIKQKLSKADTVILWRAFVKYKPEFNKFQKEKRESARKNYSVLRQGTVAEFRREFSKEIVDYLSVPTSITTTNLHELNLTDHSIVIVLFQGGLLTEVEYKFFSNSIISISDSLADSNKNNQSHDIFDTREHRIVYSRIAEYFLSSEVNKRTDLISAFVSNFTNNEKCRIFLESLILVNDSLNRYSEFWFVWKSLYPKIVEIETKRIYGFSQVLHTYLLAGSIWKEDSIEWHSLTHNEKYFYENIINDLGHLPDVFDSIVRLINGIGRIFWEQGIYWINNLIAKNKNALQDKNTFYFTEKYIFEYIETKNDEIRKDLKLKEKVINILDLLIENESAKSSILREKIL